MKVIELHLESFCFGNLTPFHLECRKSNWLSMRYEQYMRNFFLHNAHLSRAERA